jgi:NADH-quinone oxidoreductase subunit L
MRRFSGLRRALPVTHWTFLCGAGALAGVPLLSGFWSKDEIFAVLYTASHTSPHGAIYFAVLVAALLSALLTAFYTFRAYFKTFWGPERFPDQAGHHPHESPSVMAWPLRILAVCAVFVGIAEGPTAIFANYLQHAVGLEEVHEHGLEVGLTSVSTAVVLFGIGLAWWMYIRAPELPAKVAAAMGPLYRASLNKFYFDEIFWTILVAPLRGLSWFSSWFDRGIIDSIVDGAARIPRLIGAVPMWFQNGRVPSYALVMWFGMLVCVLFAMRLLVY